MNGIGLEEVNAFLRRFSYRKGWSFEATGDSYMTGATLVGRCQTKDVHTGKSMMLFSTLPLPHMVRENWMNEVTYALWHLIEQMEGHERLEWFKFDGEWVWDPHPDGKSCWTPGGPRFSRGETVRL